MELQFLSAPNRPVRREVIRLRPFAYHSMYVFQRDYFGRVPPPRSAKQKSICARSIRATQDAISASIALRSLDPMESVLQDSRALKMAKRYIGSALEHISCYTDRLDALRVIDTVVTIDHGSGAVSVRFWAIFDTTTKDLIILYYAQPLDFVADVSLLAGVVLGFTASYPIPSVAQYTCWVLGGKEPLVRSISADDVSPIPVPEIRVQVSRMRSIGA